MSLHIQVEFPNHFKKYNRLRNSKRKPFSALKYLRNERSSSEEKCSMKIGHSTITLRLENHSFLKQRDSSKSRELARKFNKNQLQVLTQHFHEQKNNSMRKPTTKGKVQTYE
ncbi:hypothetical protein FH972_012712 [Carpinus fangiana]|uniref:Uncharacterized protein n=1 Tax=Carpinus fangiana TaxID=176857 RepID=A0A5N6R5K1_9ROSI|nr:hypothetical protein FH972_012712 [Carpinus fangiana]